jgi:hypothetical protein
MGKYFANDEQRAAAYAAYKCLERMLKEDGELTPGFYKDMGGVKVTVEIPPESVVFRDKGTNGDGTIFKKAVQNLYGYAVWALMVERLSRFNQWPAVRNIIIEVMRDVLKNGSSSRSEIEEIDKEMAAQIAKLQMEFPIPPRKEQTPRCCKEGTRKPTVTIR